MWHLHDNCSVTGTKASVRAQSPDWVPFTGFGNKMNGSYNAGRRAVLKKSAQLTGLAALTNTGLTGLSAAQEDKYGIRGYEAPELDVRYWIDANGDPSSFSVDEAKGCLLYTSDAADE